MKLSLALIAAAYASEEDRHFSDGVGNFLDQDVWWWNDQTSPNSFMRKLQSATRLVNNHYFGEGSKVATRLNKFWSNLQGKMKRTGNRCTGAHQINRRDLDDEGDRGLLNDQELQLDGLGDFWTVFWAHGTWIRQALLDNPDCDNDRAMKMLRTVDRYRFISVWQYCDKIDDTEDECQWLYKWSYGPNQGEVRPNPRSWNTFQEGGKYHRDFDQ